MKSTAAPPSSFPPHFRHSRVPSVTPAKAGVQALDSRLRGNDEGSERVSRHPRERPAPHLMRGGGPVLDSRVRGNDEASDRGRDTFAEEV